MRPDLLVLGPYVIPDVDGDDGQSVIFVEDQLQAVGQRVFLVVNGNHGTLRK